ncbi:hypothetical protein GL50803_005474 [Giardia duodenalis]|uniref:Uncharacterized protein n=1 Tax=Giardia intestinalis (strain ATCC 50803 / WB clone C6) TaxID=184922 RepID=D3KI40_GIAIC|nr:hypothetical protein GL50803_005474 [Giardia intestinalis]KAE8302484.1 hypothetical protein GL50803_005474 [Giardia intestinalis]
MIHSFSFNLAGAFTEAQLEHIHLCSAHTPAPVVLEQQHQHQQSCQQPSVSPALFLIKYTGQSGEYQEQQVDLDVLDSRQVQLQTDLSVPAWHELPRQNHILPPHQPTLSPSMVPLPQQPNQLSQPDIASIVSTAECLSSRRQMDSSTQHITTMQVSQLLDTVTDCMSQSQLMQSSQLCSQILKEEHMQMRRSLQLSHADYKLKSYYPNRALRTYPCHAYLAKLIKNKGYMATIPYLRVSNEHGTLIFGSLAVGMLDLREISISRGTIDLKGPFQRMHCAVILTIHSNSRPSEKDLEELCMQIELKHQQYGSICIHTRDVIGSANTDSDCIIKVSFSLNCGAKSSTIV